MVQGAECLREGLGLGVTGLELMAQGLGFRV
jgi:hypothetical protein